MDMVCAGMSGFMGDILGGGPEEWAPCICLTPALHFMWMAGYHARFYPIIHFPPCRKLAEICRAAGVATEEPNPIAKILTVFTSGKAQARR